MINVVLVEPQIPQNTGNISRTCAIVGAHLHLVEPMGFTITEKHVKRAGLDYWDLLKLTTYPSIDDFFTKNTGGEFFYFSTKAQKNYCDVAFPDNPYFIFGKETAGLDEHIVYGNPERALRIPMRDGLRSLNLSNSVAIVVYEALRQTDFAGLT